MSEDRMKDSFDAFPSPSSAATSQPEEDQKATSTQSRTEPVADSGEEEERKQKSGPEWSLARPQISVRARLIGSLIIILALLLVVVVLNLISLTRLERAVGTMREELLRAKIAVEVSKATDDLFTALEQREQYEDVQAFLDNVGEANQTLGETQDRLQESIYDLARDDPVREQLTGLSYYSVRARNLANAVLRRAEAGDWEGFEQYLQSDLVLYYRRQTTASMEVINELASNRQAAAMADFEAARQVAHNVPIALGVLILVVGLATTIDTMRSIAQPLQRLTTATARLAAGQLGERVRVRHANEFGRLAVAFNEMADRVQTSYGELEKRVAERTRAFQEANYALQRRAMQLEATTQVGQAITSIFDIDQLLARTVSLIRDNFGFYHVGIFLMDEAGEWAVLREATGEAGARMKEVGHRLRVGETSMVGWSAMHREARIALDVGEDAVHFNNPFLPYTRSEIALPLLVGGRLLGVLNVQSTDEAAFDDDDVRVLQGLADQIAIAIENARRVSDEAALLEATSPIYRASRRLTRATSVQEVTEAIIASVAEAGADGCLVVLFEFSPSGEPEVLSYVGVWRQDREPQFKPGMRLPIAESPFSLDMVSTLWAVSDVAKSDQLSDQVRQTFQETGVAAVVNVPLRSKDRVMGQVVVLRATAGSFSEAAMRLYETISDQAAVALERARLLEIAHRRVEEEATLRAISDRVVRAMDVETVLRSATEGLSQVLKASGIFVELGPGLVSGDGEKAPAEDRAGDGLTE